MRVTQSKPLSAGGRAPSSRPSAMTSREEALRGGWGDPGPSRLDPGSTCVNSGAERRDGPPKGLVRAGAHGVLSGGGLPGRCFPPTTRAPPATSGGSAGGWSLRAGCPSAWRGLACLCQLGGFLHLSRVPRPLAKVRDPVAQKELGTDGLPPLPRDSGLCHQAGRLPSSPIMGSPSDRHLISRISVNNAKQLELQRGSSLKHSAQLPSQLVLPRRSRQDCV